MLSYIRHLVVNQISGIRRMTLRSYFFDLYLPEARRRKKRPDFDVNIYVNHIDPHFGESSLSRISKSSLNAWLDEQIAMGLQKSTINKHICLLNKLLETAHAGGYMGNYSQNFHKLKQIKISHFRQRFLSSSEIEKILKCCERSVHPYIKFFVELLLLTGARSGEALGAKWHDINFSSKIWTIPVSKNGKIRFIYLNDQALTLLTSLRGHSTTLHGQIEESDYIFKNPTTKKQYKGMHAAWYRVRDDAGIAEVRIHDLRHTYASILVNQGASLYDVQKLLGHSSPQMTQRYAHLSSERLLSAAVIVGNFIRPNTQ